MLNQEITRREDVIIGLVGSGQRIVYVQTQTKIPQLARGEVERMQGRLRVTKRAESKRFGGVFLK